MGLKIEAKSIKNQWCTAFPLFKPYLTTVYIQDSRKIYWKLYIEITEIIIVIQKKNKFTKKYSLSIYKFFPWPYLTMTFNIKGLFGYCSFKSDIVISSKHLQSTAHKAEKSDPDRNSKTSLIFTNFDTIFFFFFFF